ncbi:MAG: HAD family phosphatase [Pirellulaceae bacterium]
MPPRFLYFDLGKVLLQFDHHLACRQMAEAAGVDRQLVWKVAFEGPLFVDYERGDVSSDEYYQRFCAATGSRPDREALQRAGSDIFWLNAPTAAIVTQLKLSGQRMGILSNTNEAHWQFIDRGHYGILNDRWEQYALSFRLRSMKPEPEIYRAAAEMARVSPREIFFVDDRPDNVEGALRAGFDAVQYTTAAALAADLHRRGVRFNF